MNNAVQILNDDGIVTYLPGFFSISESTLCYEALRTDVKWESDRVKLFGKTIITERKTAWYGDEPYDYRYSGTTKSALIWTPLLMKIRERLRSETGFRFNSCLANLYHKGEEGMSWHSDKEKTMDPRSPIASISFGAARRFCFRHRSGLKNAEILLETGSLLMMYPPLQEHWQHALPKMQRIREGRINLTFRHYIPER